MNVTLEPGGIETVNRIARDLAKAEGKVREHLARHFRYGVLLLAKDAEDTYRSVTPVLTGALQASTVATAEYDSDLDCRIVIRQPATNRGGDFYVQFVILGHKVRGTSGRMVPPQPYDVKANAILAPAIERFLRRTGADAATSISHDVRGIP